MNDTQYFYRHYKGIQIEDLIKRERKDFFLPLSQFSFGNWMIFFASHGVTQMAKILRIKRRRTAFHQERRQSMKKRKSIEKKR